MVVNADGVKPSAHSTATVYGDVTGFKRNSSLYEPQGEILTTPPLHQSFEHALSNLNVQTDARIVSAEADIYTQLSLQRVELTLPVEHDESLYVVKHAFEPE